MYPEYRLRYFAFIQSTVRTIRTDGPCGRSVRTVRADGPYGRSVRTVRADGPYVAVVVASWPRLGRGCGHTRQAAASAAAEAGRRRRGVLAGRGVAFEKTAS